MLAAPLFMRMGPVEPRTAVGSGTGVGVKGGTDCRAGKHSWILLVFPEVRVAVRNAMSSTVWNTARFCALQEG